MITKTLLAVLGYVVVSLVLAMPWHFVWFADLYESFGIYNRDDPVIALGVLSMLVQGAVMAYVYPRFYRGGPPALEGLAFGLLFGVFLFSVSTLANAAKIEVTSLEQFVVVQAAFHVLQFGITGPVIGLTFGRSVATAPMPSIVQSTN